MQYVTSGFADDVTFGHNTPMSQTDRQTDKTSRLVFMALLRPQFRTPPVPNDRFAYLKNTSKLHENMVSVAVAWSSSDNNVIRYVLPVLRMTIMGKRDVCP